jgi:hypothetical protein
MMSDLHKKSHSPEHDAPVVHTAEEGFDHTEPRTAWIAAFGAFIVLTLVITIFGIQYYFDRYSERQIYTQVLEPVADDLTNLRDREDIDLHQDKYVDRKTGTVRISIERAMDLLVKEYAEGRLPYSTAPQAVKPIEPEGAPAPDAVKPAQ